MPSLFDHLAAAPFEFDFSAAAPQLRLVGTDAPPDAEAARFRAHMSLAFPPAQIMEFLPPTGEDGDERAVPMLTLTFLGLYGPSRVLPTHYTQLLLDTHRE